MAGMGRAGGAARGVPLVSYTTMDLTQCSQARWEFIYSVRLLGGWLDATSTAEDIHAFMTECFQVDELSHPDVASLASSFQQLKYQLNQHGADIGDGSADHSPHLRIPFVLAEWLFPPGPQLDHAKALAVAAITSPNTWAAKAAAPPPVVHGPGGLDPGGPVPGDAHARG